MERQDKSERVLNFISSTPALLLTASQKASSYSRDHSLKTIIQTGRLSIGVKKLQQKKEERGGGRGECLMQGRQQSHRWLDWTFQSYSVSVVVQSSTSAVGWDLHGPYKVFQALTVHMLNNLLSCPL